MYIYIERDMYGKDVADEKMNSFTGQQWMDTLKKRQTNRWEPIT